MFLKKRCRVRGYCTRNITFPPIDRTIFFFGDFGFFFVCLSSSSAPSYITWCTCALPRLSWTLFQLKKSDAKRGVLSYGVREGYRIRRCISYPPGPISHALSHPPGPISHAMSPPAGPISHAMSHTPGPISHAMSHPPGPTSHAMSHPPGPIFRARYLNSSWNGGGAKQVGVGNISPRAFRRHCRSVLLASSWLSSSRAWKTAPC